MPLASRVGITRPGGSSVTSRLCHLSPTTGSCPAVERPVPDRWDCCAEVAGITRSSTLGTVALVADESDSQWLSWVGGPPFPRDSRALRPALIIRAATLVDDTDPVPWWWIKHSRGTRQIVGRLDGDEKSVAAALTVTVPPDAPQAVRVDGPGASWSQLFVVVAARHRPLDGERDGIEFTGVTDPRTSEDLSVWSSFTRDSYTLLTGSVPGDLSSVRLTGIEAVTVPISSISFNQVGWEGVA